MTIQLLHERATQGWKCQQCGLPGVRLSTRPGSSGVTSRAYYKCVPCNRSLGLCPCTTPGDMTTSTCPCSDSESSDVESPGLEDQPAGFSLLSVEKKQSFNPHNPNSGFDEDWETNCSPGYMVSRFKARGRELLF
ncbi:hypothetical protein N7466_007906 [Penicillium verhagenii]|uniref:uncharacterized protein n=1 Tax=Penicillium verhagenii TaxID=1562060 RepID=UPI002544ECAA|nr:uncharacterized protein N7466_007906 [Penicillium verhagenii]KAJ5928950.1 hypothetical protein N7466_007906 [Penicillium verhagenii]